MHIAQQRHTPPTEAMAFSLAKANLQKTLVAVVQQNCTAAKQTSSKHRKYKLRWLEIFSNELNGAMVERQLLPMRGPVDLHLSQASPLQANAMFKNYGSNVSKTKRQMDRGWGRRCGIFCSRAPKGHTREVDRMCGVAVHTHILSICEKLPSCAERL